MGETTTAPAFVSGRFLDDLLRLLSRRRIDVPRLLADLPIDREALRQGHPLVEWDVFVELLGRLELQVGGPRGLEELGRGVGELKPARILRRLAGLSASPYTLYRTAERWALRRAIPLLESRIERVGADRLKVASVIPEPHRPCPALFHVATGVLRAAPRMLGLADAVVTADVQPARAEWSVFLPSSGTLRARARRAFSALFSARAAFDQLETQQGELQRHFLELRAAYAVLEESEARHRALTESAVDLVFECDREARLTYVSPSSVELTGYRPDEVLGAPFTRWLHPDDAGSARDAFERELVDSSARQLVFRVRHREGGWRFMEIEGRPYSMSDGEVRFVAICRDVSDRVRLEAERRRHQEDLEAEVARRTAQLERRNRELRELQRLLLEAERIDAAQNVAERVAHSIQGPLSALIGHLQLAVRQGRDSAQAAVLGRTLGLAVNVHEVVQRSLRLYREGKVDRRPEDPGALLDAVAEQIEGRAALVDARVEVGVPDDVPPVHVDRALLVSALVAIAENALDGLPQAGRLALAVARAGEGDGVEFRVEDDGPGLAAGDPERLFDPWHSTERTGAGLGLAIARGIVHGHGGRIAVEPGPDGRGTRVRVELPGAGRPHDEEEGPR